MWMVSTVVFWRPNTKLQKCKSFPSAQTILDPANAQVQSLINGEHLFFEFTNL